MLADVNNEPAKQSFNWFNPVICQVILAGTANANTNVLSNCNEINQYLLQYLNKTFLDTCKRP